MICRIAKKYIYGQDATVEPRGLSTRKKYVIYMLVKLK
jgi:hypothetical protein